MLRVNTPGFLNDVRIILNGIDSKPFQKCVRKTQKRFSIGNFPFSSVNNVSRQWGFCHTNELLVRISCGRLLMNIYMWSVCKWLFSLEKFIYSQEKKYMNWIKKYHFTHFLPPLIIMNELNGVLVLLFSLLSCQECFR